MGFLSPHYNYNSYPSQTFQTTNNNSQTITFQHHHEQEQELFQLSQQQQTYDFDETFSSYYLDENLIFQSPYFYSNETNYPCQDQLLIDKTFSFNQNDGFISMNENFPTNEEDFSNYHPFAKRQKLCYEEKTQQQEQEHLNSSNFFVDEFIANPFSSFEAEQFSASNIVDVVDIVQCEKKIRERTISTQSIAARERRRKITEKTQELGKLVPGGPKMNTAEMLNAAASYVRFLQAQVGMLQVMETFTKEEKEPPSSEDLHKLIVSPFVQEKLYSEEKCFIPKAIITTLTNNIDVKSKPSILQDLKQLVGTEIDHEKKQKQE